MKKDIQDANFPKDASGAPYHIQTTNVASRILTVGELTRARKICTLLTQVEEISGTRGFTVINGLYKGIKVSIISIGMGYPMMDMMVREVRQVVQGDLRIIRFGSCGSISHDLSVGSIAVADSSCFISNVLNTYSISDIVEPSIGLTQQLFKEIKGKIRDPVVMGLNATCDSFYSSQGRRDDKFRDENQNLINDLKEKYPKAITMEMETFQLFSLALKSVEKIEVASCTMIYASRLTKGREFISPEKIEEFVMGVGKCILDVLIS